MRRFLEDSLRLACGLSGRVYAAAARVVLPDLERCFDHAYYLNRYPDVQHSGMNPLGHFLLYGAREGRQPNPFFDIRHYLSGNPDVAAAGINPLVHFLRYGWKEGRRPNVLFDAAFYAAKYPDRRYPNPFVDYVVRRRKGEKPQAALPFSLPAKSYQVATSVRDATVDIIIPVYSGLEETRRCLESVLGATCGTPYAIVLINDRAPDPALGEYLRMTAETHGLTLLENDENLGFAASVNRGLGLHADRDVVLLNNDTEVANDWLDRMAAAAYIKDVGSSHKRTGTVTPFSNNATICSYPQGNALTAELDQVFREVNAGHRVTIPTAVGFCMYIRRDCLNDVGVFRPEVFGKGYGEENDFCLRAIYKGWEHVLAADTFVYHAGETSFASEAEARRKTASEIIERLYPQYECMIADYQRRDPAKPYRIAVSAWRMRHSGKSVVLAISHGLGGGVAQYIRELGETLTWQAEILLLTPMDCGAVVLRRLASGNDPPDNDFSVAFDPESGYPALLELLRRCGVMRIHVQHMAGHALDVQRLKYDLNVPMDFSVHDYFVICPQITLTDAAGRYCGEPDEAGCNACLAGRPPLPDEGGRRFDIQAWRQKYRSLVEVADRVIAPSHDAAERFKRYFPGVNLIVAAHPSHDRISAPASPRPLLPDEPLVIVVLGAMTLHKGIGRLRAAASEAQRQKLPLRFVLAGYAVQTSQSHEPFVQTGAYHNDQLPGLLQEAGAQVIWFPAQWPETFSYTLSASLEMGMPVIAPDIGAFDERVAGRNWTWIVPWDWDINHLLEFFLSVRRNHFLTGLAPAVPSGDGKAAQSDFYPVEYLRPLRDR